MFIKTILLDQFTTCYDENGWFVALKNAIAGLNVEQAAWKPEGADNSIWGILSHLNFYNHAYLQRFRGAPITFGSSVIEQSLAREANGDARIDSPKASAAVSAPLSCGTAVPPGPHASGTIRRKQPLTSKPFQR